MEMVKMAMEMKKVYLISIFLLITTAYFGNVYLAFIVLLIIVAFNADSLKDFIEEKFKS